ncbi:MAG: hypothetical protein DRJ13_06735 [Bacteroidetes bacterium]|nr:MAG: hypothetical protein DRJ13_06735 [Bacteroidota bacterium]
MSEIFLKLRIKEMLEGKMKRYIIFGIVEVFLVVTGILIALSINNWDIKKSKRTDELKIYENISNRILEDKKELQGVIDYNKRLYMKYQFANQIISENDRSKLDTLIRIAPELLDYSDFNRSSNVYQNLINSGELKLLSNTTIITLLQDLEEAYIYLNRMESIHPQFILDYIGPLILNNIHLSTSIAEKPDELYTFQFQNLFFASIDLMEEKDEIYKWAQGAIGAISLLIEEEGKQ